MKTTKKNLTILTFWLSLFSGIPNLLGLVPFQSLNISVFPAIILLLKSNKVIYLDCFIALVFLTNYFITLLFFSSFSGIRTFLEFASLCLKPKPLDNKPFEQITNLPSSNLSSRSLKGLQPAI